MKNEKKVLLILLGISICALVFLLVQIYAKYLSSATGDVSMQIANWNILVNNLSIKNNTDISSTIVPVFPGNSHIASNIIAPTAEGYFDLNLDFTNTDVSFVYEINVSAAQASSVSDLVAVGYSVDSGPRINFQNFNEPITETILLGSNINTRSIRVFVKWNDDAQTASMSNVNDTLATISGDPALFDVNISFTQITETPANNVVSNNVVPENSNPL